MEKIQTEPGDYVVVTDTHRDLYCGVLVHYDRALQHAVVRECRKIWRYYVAGCGIGDLAVNGLTEGSESRIDTPTPLHEIGDVHSVILTTDVAERSLREWR